MNVVLVGVVRGHEKKMTGEAGISPGFQAYHYQIDLHSDLRKSILNQ